MPEISRWSIFTGKQKERGGGHFNENKIWMFLKNESDIGFYLNRLLTMFRKF